MEDWFGAGLIGWYAGNKRDLPWRNTRDPYKIWLSEVILQQTQVAQGLFYYLRFVQEFPTVKQLAEAHEDQVLKLWQGLGYYSRARNLHNAAKSIMDLHKGEFPKDYKSIRDLKGVGDYTAAAISSFAYNFPHAVLDGNVFRVLSRVFGIRLPIDSGIAKREFQQLTGQLLDLKDPATYNQAIMEFGSQYCKPVNPDCSNCIFSDRCAAFKEDIVSLLPLKSKKVKIRKRYFNYLLISDKKNNIIVNKRSTNDIWGGLYEFKLVETRKDTGTKTLFASGEIEGSLKGGFDILHTSKKYKHVLSHQHLHARFYVIRASGKLQVGEQKIELSRLSDLAFPRLIDKFLEDCDLKEIL